MIDKLEEGTRSREVQTQFLGNAKIKSLQSDGLLDMCSLIRISLMSNIFTA